MCYIFRLIIYQCCHKCKLNINCSVDEIYLRHTSSTVDVHVISHEMELHESKFGQVYLHTEDMPHSAYSFDVSLCQSDIRFTGAC